MKPFNHWNGGFFIYAMILFLPFLLCLSAGGFWIVWFLIQKQKMDNLCYYHAFKSQEILVGHNNFVLKLNPLAMELIQAKKFFLAAQFSPHPLASVVSRKLLSSIKKAQKGLKLIRQKTLDLGNGRSFLEVQKIRKGFYENVSQIKKFWGTRGPAYIHIYWRKSQVQADSKYKAEIAPPYRRLKGHGDRQKLTVWWVVSMEILFPGWMREYVPVEGNWRGQCSTYPKKQSTRSGGRGESQKGGSHWLATMAIP